jgi:hypothetical protein
MLRARWGWLIAAVAVLLAFLLSALPVTRTPYDLPLFLVAFGIFTAPGWPFARWFLGSGASWLARVPFSLLFGYVWGIVTYIALRLTIGTSPMFVLVACALVTVAFLAWLPRRGGDDADALLPMPTLTRGDGIALAVLLLAVALIVGPVFANVGRETPRGIAYRAYFFADLFAHMSVVAELTRNTTPPLNPYYPAEPLPYYWGFFTFPALYDDLHDALMRHVTIDRGILFTDLTMAGVYVSVWFLVLRAIGASTVAALSAWLVAIFASSFEGAFFWWTQAARGRSVWEFRYLNIDALTRWLWDLPPTDGLHRLFWWTPQHGIAITLGLVVFGIAACARKPNGLARGLMDGLLLGVAFICSSFNGVLLVAAYAAFETIALVRARFAEFRRWLLARGTAAAIVILFAGGTLVLGMIQRSATEVILRLNPHFVLGPWTFLGLSFGPPLFIAPFGLRRLWAWSPRAVIATGTIVAITAMVFLFIDLRGHENSYVTFRTAQLWYLLLAVLVAAAIDASRAWPRPAAVTLWATLAAGSLLAVPTVALDWYNARDITNMDMSPGGFPWTVYISPENQAALAWIETTLPDDAIVQADVNARGRATWALIPAFSEHRMSVGRGIFEPNPKRFDQGAGNVSVIYRTPDTALAYQYCESMGIQYVYVGPEERAANGPNVDKFARDPARFGIIYRNSGVTVYLVKGMTARKAQRGGPS